MDPMPKTYALTVEKRLEATPEQAFAAFADAATWNAVHGCHTTEIDLQVGGRVVVRFFADREGGETFVYRAIEAPRRLVFCWEGHEEQSVTVAIEDAAGGVVVRVTQACGAEPAWIANALDGWAWVLDSLERFLATGRGIGHEAWSRDHAPDVTIGPRRP